MVPDELEGLDLGTVQLGDTAFLVAVADRQSVAGD